MENLTTKSTDYETISNEIANPKGMFWHTKNGKITKLLLQIIFVIFLTMSLARVPYVGAFFDATIFSIPFGYTKYFAYFLIYLYVILTWIPKWKQKIFNWKNAGIVGLVWLIVSLIISCICVLINYNVLSGNAKVFRDYFVGQPDSYFTYWANNDWANVNKSAWFYLNPKSYGGLLSFVLVVLFESLAPLVLAIIMFASLGVIIGWQIKKHYHPLKQKTSHQISNVCHESWLTNQANLAELKKNEEAKIYLDNLDKTDHKLPIGSLNNLNETTEDFKQDLTVACEKFIGRMETFLTSLNIDFSCKNKEIMFKSFSCTFSFANRRGSKVLTENLEQLKLEFSDLEINYYFDENNNFIVSQKLDLKPIVSIREVIKTIGTKNHYCLGLGKLSDRHNIFVQGLLEPTIGVYGSKGSGHSMFVSNLLLSLTSLNEPNILEIDIIDTTSKTFKGLTDLPQVASYVSANEECYSVLDKYIELIKTRLQLIQNYKCRDIYSYYNNIEKAHDLKIHLLVVHGLEELAILDHEQCWSKLEFILENAKATGIICVFASNLVSQEIIQLNKYYDNIVCFKLATEANSWDVIDGQEAYYLWGNGDGLIKTVNGTYHFQTSFVNKEETNNIIDTIKNNYVSVKEY